MDCLMSEAIKLCVTNYYTEVHRVETENHRAYKTL